MGISASSLLDDTKSNYIKGRAEAELKDFSPYYRKQFSVARLSQVEDDLEQHKQKITQLLKQREAPEDGAVLYEEGVLYFDDARKWKERYVVVRANYCLECHDSLESFVKGVPPSHKLLPTGGTVLTTEESYMAMVDKCFPDDSSVKEDFVPPLSGMPGQFPVYLRLPYRRDSYFCFRQQVKQAAFLSILSDCIRHQNQDFLKKKTCEVQAFLKAIQLYRQDKGKYEAWDMLIGSDVRVMANVVMEQLLPSLEKDTLPRLKAKKTEKKRVWFATVEAAYILVQEHLLDGLSALKEECRTSARQQEVTIHSDMDQILGSRRQLEGKIQAKVSEPAEKLCTERVQPYLGSVLEELMQPISSGFLEGRQLIEGTMDQVCQDVLQGGDNEKLKKALADMARPNLLGCYQKIGSLQDKLPHLQERFGFSNITGVIHSAQIDLQQLTENAAFTFEQLLHKAVQDNPDSPDSAGSAIEKAKHRVLKQYDYDSSTVRKRISQDALVSITLPFLKKNLAPTCKTELQDLEQDVYSDHSHFIHVENVYESILLHTLDKEVTKVLKEAASLKKYNLFTDSRDLLSQSSRSSLSSPSVSTPSSPSMALASPAKTSPEPQPPSPLVVNGLSSSPQKEPPQEKENDAPQGEASTAMETPPGEVEQKEVAPNVAAAQEAEPPAPEVDGVVRSVKAEVDDVVQTVKAEVDGVDQSVKAEVDGVDQTVTAEVEGVDQSVKAEVEGVVQTVKAEVDGVVQTVKAEVGSAGTPEATPSVEETPPSGSQDAAAAPETVIHEQVISVQSEETAEPEAQVTEALQEAEITLTEPPTAVESIKTEPAAAALVPSPDPTNEPVNLSAEGTGSQPVAVTAETTQRQSPEVQLEAPSGGEAPEEVVLKPEGEEAEAATVSDPNSLDVSVGSESPPSDLESTDEVSTTSDILDDEANLSKSPVSSDDNAEDKTTSDEPSPPAQTEAAGGGVGVGVAGETEAGASVDAEAADAATSPSAEPAREETTLSSPEVPPPDCIKEIRDLVVEVIEVEELVQRYPGGVPKEE